MAETDVNRDPRLCQVSVLKFLCRGTQGSEPKHYRINDVIEQCERAGSGDEKEVRRSLFVLEGHKLVAPFPAGDFTSKTWHITADGVKALKKLDYWTVL